MGLNFSFDLTKWILPATHQQQRANAATESQDMRDSEKTISIFTANTHTAPEQVVPCVLWSGAIDALGYGRRVTPTTSFAHVAAYEAAYGQVPEGHEIDHTCSNPACVEPLHLEAVTHAENCRRRHERAGFTKRECVPRSKVDGECSRGHALTADNVYTVPTTGRSRCRVCRSDRMNELVRRRATETQNRRAAAANTAPETIDALAEATAAHLRLIGKWQPHTLRDLLADLPGDARMDQLVGGAL